MEAIFQTIINEAAALAPQLSADRRDFHKHAELGWLEMRTASRIARRLTDLGFDEVLVGKEVCREESRMGLPAQEQLDQAYERAVRQGGDPEFLPAVKGGFTGVIGVLHCGEGPVVGLRFDIDALPIQEAEDDSHFPSAQGFASVNEGVMHACGHDGHAAIGLGVAALLMRHRDALHGTVKLVFQPAEEGVRGAKAMVDSGLLADVDYMLGSHIGGRKDTTEQVIEVGDHPTLATSKLNVTFTGQPAHAAGAPEEGKNAMLAAATAVLNLHAIPRYGKGSTRVNVGKLVAGTGRNIICDHAVMEVEVRGDSTAANAYMEQYARQIIEAAAAMHGCQCSISMAGAAQSNHNTPALNARVKQICEEYAQMRCREQNGGPNGSEDYAFMSEHVQQHGGQSCYFDNIVRCAGPGHSHYFDFDEQALVNGVAAFCVIVADLLRK